MGDCVGSIITLARAVHTSCAKAKACRSLLVIVERKMDSLIPIMEEVQNHVELLDSATVLENLTTLQREIQDTKLLVDKGCKMSRIGFIINSSDLREKVEINLRSIHLSMTGLQVSHSSSIAADLKEFHASWKAREAELQEEKKRVESLRQRLADTLANPAESNRQNIANVAGIDIDQVDELERELARAKAERDQMGLELGRAIAAQDTVRRDKASAEAKFMDQILSVLSASSAMASPLITTSSRPVPDSCYCPILGTIMEDPVMVDSECGCNHTMERSAAKHWIELGNTSCPICHSHLHTRRLSPNVLLRNLISELQVTDAYQHPEFTMPPKPEPTVSPLEESPSNAKPSINTDSHVKELADAVKALTENQREKEIRHYRIQVDGDIALFSGRVNKDEEPHGQGRMKMPDGSVYEGNFKDGVRHGLGHLTLKNKNVYHGDFQNGEMEGVGKLTYKNGNLYEGEFKHSVMEGIGTLTTRDYNHQGVLVGTTVYSGEFKNGQKHGKGSLRYWDGSSYTGIFRNNEKVGSGTYRSPQGMEWLGQCKASSSGLGVKRIIWFPNGNCEVGVYDVSVDFDVSEFEMCQGLHFSKDRNVAYYYTNIIACCGETIKKRKVSISEAQSLASSMGYKCTPDIRHPGYEGIVQSCKAQLEYIQ